MRSAVLAASLRALARARSRPARRHAATGSSRCRRAGARGAGAGRPARPGRASPGRRRARVVRPRRAAASPARLARRASEGGRAGRAGGARPLPARLARDRPARDAARGARPAAGAASARLAVGERGASAAVCPGYQPASLDALCATGEVVWVGAGLDRVALFFRDRRSAARCTRRCAAPEGEAAEAMRGALGRAARVLARPARAQPGWRPRTRCPRSGSWSGRAR